MNEWLAIVQNRSFILQFFVVIENRRFSRIVTAIDDGSFLQVQNF